MEFALECDVSLQASSPSKSCVPQIRQTWIVPATGSDLASPVGSLGQSHIGGKARCDLAAKRAKDPLKLVIVRDMWLTGFDSPSMQTMSVNQPLNESEAVAAFLKRPAVVRASVHGFDCSAGLIGPPHRRRQHGRGSARPDRACQGRPKRAQHGWGSGADSRGSRPLRCVG